MENLVCKKCGAQDFVEAVMPNKAVTTVVFFDGKELSREDLSGPARNMRVCKNCGAAEFIEPGASRDTPNEGGSASDTSACKKCGSRDMLIKVDASSDGGFCISLGGKNISVKAGGDFGASIAVCKNCGKVEIAKEGRKE